MSQKEEKTNKKNTDRDERGRFTKGNRASENVRFERENAAACKYKEQYADELIEYFSEPSTRIEHVERYNNKGQLTGRVPTVIVNEYPTFERFAANHGVCVRTLLNWCEKSRRFANAYLRAKEIQKAILIENTMQGRYDASFARFIAINYHDMEEKTKNDNTVTFNINLPSEIDEESL